MAFSIGYITTTFSAIFNGCFAVIFRQFASEVHPLAFTAYFSVGFLMLYCLSIALDVFNPAMSNFKETADSPVFCPLGLFSGFTVTATFNFTWYAVRVPSVGLATAQGIVSTFNALVSFMVGAFLFDNVIYSWADAAIGLILLVVGVSGVVTAKTIPAEPRAKVEADSKRVGSNGAAEGSAQLSGDLPSPYERAEKPASSQAASSFELALKPDEAEQQLVAPGGGIWLRLLGCASAAAAGTAGGFTLAGLSLSPAECQGIVYLPSIGIGCVVSQIGWLGAQLIVTIWTRTRAGLEVREYILGELKYNTRSYVHVLAGMAAGVIYGAGLWLSLISTYYIGEALAGPIFQFNIILDGLWGVILYKEIVGWRGISLFFVSAALVVAAGILLAQATNVSTSTTNGTNVTNGSAN